MKERILIVDDDPGIRESLELFLTQEDYQVAVAAEADAARTQLGMEDSP